MSTEHDQLVATEKLQPVLIYLLRRRKDCGVCGVEATAWVKVTDDGYFVPRCQAHCDREPYQAEARLDEILGAFDPGQREEAV